MERHIGIIVTTNTMAALKLLYFMVILTVSYNVCCGEILDSWINDIPARCINNTKTKFSCKGQYAVDGLTAHPDDCQLFYYCISPYLPPVCRQCPAQLHFNRDLHVCDLPVNARCNAPIK